MIPSSTNVVVFDLDETLGHFSQLSLIWKLMTGSSFIPESRMHQFYNLLDLFPEYSRPGIEQILKYVSQKKQSRACKSVMIYTNNNGPKEWAASICGYYENKIGESLFDRIIGAFMIGDEVIEPNRTTSQKTHEDLLRCTELPAETEICFIDDRMHTHMRTDRVFFIKIKPYTKTLPVQEVCERIEDNTESLGITDNDARYMCSKLRDRETDGDLDGEERDIEGEVDRIVGKQILSHLEAFFKLYGRRQTRRNKPHRTSRGTRRR